MTLFADQFVDFVPESCEFSIEQSLADETETKQRSLVHLVSQIFGQRNVFGYTSTIVNKIHLMYYFLGEFYVSRVFSNRIRWFWILFNILSCTLAFIQCSSCILWSSKREITKIYFSIQVSTTVAYYLIIIPAIACVNRNHTAESLKILDRTINLQPRSTGSFTRRQKYHALGVISASVVIQVTLMSFYCSSSWILVIFGYTKDDLKNSVYYLFPVYCDYVDTLTEYLTLLFYQMIFSLPTLGSPFLIPIFVILSIDRFHNKFQEISDALDCNSKMFSDSYEYLLNESCQRKQIEMQKHKLVVQFTRDIHSYAKLHHELLRGINHFKFYLQSSISISLAIFLFTEVMLFYIFILFEDESLLLRMKILCFAFGMFNILFVNCAAGNLLADMGDMFRDSVYNIPWYYLPSHSRKSVYLLLYQAQVTIGFNALRVYPMNMELFDRFCRYVYSAVSVLGGYHNAH